MLTTHPLAAARPGSVHTTDRTTTHLRFVQKSPMVEQINAWYASERGYAALGYINGDPRKENMLTEWYEWPRQRQAYIQRAEHLAQRFGNIYAPAVLFSEKNKQATNALPSKWLGADDVQPNDVFSMLVNTSKGNYQGFIELDTPLSTDDRAALLRGLRVEMGGDTCTSNPVQFFRLAGGFNTKHHGRYPVEVTIKAHPPLSVLAAHERWYTTSQATNGATLNLEAVELAHGNVGVLVERARRSLRQGTPAAVTLTQGNISDNSTARYSVIGGLVAVGFPDEEIAALIHYWSDNGPLAWGHLTGKAIKHRSDDIERVIGKHRAKMTYVQVRPTHNATAMPTKPLAKRSGRPQANRKERMTAAHHLAWLQDASNRLFSRGEAAKAHGVSTKTVQRWETKNLQNDVKRVTHHHISSVQLIRVDKLAAPPARVDKLAAVSTLETSVSTHQEAVNENILSIYTHPPVLSVCSAPSVEFVQSENVSDALAAGTVGGVFLQDVDGLQSLTLAQAVELVLPQVDKAEFGRKRLKAVRDTLAVVYGFTNADDVNAEIKRQESIFAKERRECWKMAPSKLVSRIEALTKRATRNIGKRGEAKDLYFLKIANEVLAMRKINLDEVKASRVKKGKKTERSAALKPCVAPQVEQITLEAADVATASTPIPMRVELTTDWRSLVERLKARSAHAA